MGNIDTSKLLLANKEEIVRKIVKYIEEAGTHYYLVG